MEFIEKIAIVSENGPTQKRKNHSKKGAVIALSSIPLIMTLGNSMLIPVLPMMENEMNISSFQTSLIITVYSIVAILLIPVAGFISDHIGRKKVIIPSLIIAAIGGLVSSWAAWKIKDPYWIILLGRTLQGIGAAGAAPIVMPLIGDMFKDEEEVSASLGMIETSNTFGKVLSPILGAYLASIIWFLPFLAFPAFCLIAIVLMAFLVKTKHMEFEPIPFKQFRQKIKEIFRENGRWLLAAFFIGTVLMFVLFAVLFYLSEILETDYGMYHVKKGLLLAIPLGALCVFSLLTGKIIKENKVLMKWITFASLLLLAVSIATLSFSKKLPFILSAFFLSGVGIGASLPCLDSFITEGIEKKQRGTITSIYHSMRFIGVAAGPPAMAILMDKWPQFMFYLLGGIALLACAASFFAIRPEK